MRSFFVSSCQVVVTSFSAALMAPTVADFDQDGRKEIIFCTADVFVEALVGANGDKAEGWPLALAGAVFLASPLVYDIDNSGKLDVVATTESGSVVFIDQSGVPLFNYTLQISPAPMDARWFEGLTDAFGEAYWELMRRGDVKSAPNRYRHRTVSIADQMPDPHEPNEPNAAPFAEQLHLSEEGLKSFEVFFKTKLPPSYGKGLAKQQDALRSPTYEERIFDPATEVLVPPHILATPVIAALERDGVDMLIVPVSYYYSTVQARQMKRYNLNEKHAANMFSVAGIAVFDLKAHSLLWQIELGATLNQGKQRALVYGSPVVADLDGNGIMEIVIGDGSGHIHVVTALGAVVSPWPVRLAPLAASLVVEDVAGDEKLEIIALDAKGSLVCFDWLANELWSVQVYTGSVPPLDNGPTVGDIDGNGSIDVVIGTAEGFLYAFDGENGKPLAGFPLQFPASIRAEVALVHLRSPGLHLIFVAGSNLYLVDGAKPQPSCVFSVPVGESSFSAVAVDDFTGRGMTDIVVTCASGHVVCLSTEIPFHPLNAWSTPWSGGTKNAANYGYHGVFAENRGARDVTGSSLPLRFTIVDKRRKASSKIPHYNVTVSINGFSAFTQTYSSPGTYTAALPVPLQSNAAITLWMENEAHRIYTDFFSVSFNVRFYRLLKYVLLAPLSLLVVTVAWRSDRETRDAIL